MCGLSLVAVSGGYSPVAVQGLLIAVASPVAEHGLQSMRASVAAACGLECALSGCGTWAQMPHSMWNLPGSGIEYMSPALTGGFLTTGLPGKSWLSILTIAVCSC